MLFTMKTLDLGFGEFVQSNDIPAMLSILNHFRASAENVINADFIHCLCIDSGNFKTLSLDKIRTLPNQFRKMPKLAMKAKLYGE